MSQRPRRRRFRINTERLQTVCGNAWYAFMLAGAGALAFRSREPTLQAICTGTGSLVFGLILFVIAVTDWLEN